MEDAGEDLVWLSLMVHVTEMRSRRAPPVNVIMLLVKGLCRNGDEALTHRVYTYLLLYSVS